MNKKYDYFRTSDGHLWVVPVRPERDPWTSQDVKFARRFTFVGILIVALLLIANGLFIYQKLRGG